MKRKNIAIDMDGTICEELPTFQRCLSKPIKDGIDVINKLYEFNNIIIFTARSWSEYDMTKDWLEKNNVKYHQLICGKPVYDIFIDDRCIGFTNWRDIEGKING